MNYNGIPVTFPTRISELEFNTVMDTGFFGEYTLTPEIHSHPYYELLAARSMTSELKCSTVI